MVLLGMWMGSQLIVSAEDLLFRGATVHTVSGETISPGDVLVHDGKIFAIGRQLSSPGARVIDVAGQHLYPGLVAMDTVLGLTEIDAVRSTQDSVETGEYTADVESWIAVNPDSELVPVARANGVAIFETIPVGRTISGRSGVLATSGWTYEEMALKTPAALQVFWPEFSLNTLPKERSPEPAKWKSLEEQAKERRASVRSLADFFEEAKAYAKAKAAAGGTAPEVIPAWEAMLPFVRGDLPIVVHADEVRQIRSAIAWAATNHFKVILAGGRDAAMVAELLATNRIPVVFEHTFTQPVRDTEAYDVHFSSPEKLRRAGVLVALSVGPSTPSAWQVRNLPNHAAQAMAFGLPPAEALKAITLYPAQILGLADRFGSIEVGKDATLFVSDGDILDLRSHVKHLWIGGNEVSLETRHTRLYEKYKNRPR